AGEGVLYSDFKSEDFSLAEIIESGLRTSKIGLITAFEQARLAGGVNLLVVADQFEELFRYQRVGASGSGTEHGLLEEAKAFVDLLLEVCRHPSLPVYVVLTMRSDFLGDCSQFVGLPEAINGGQYLVPRMNRDERRLAIVGPVGVGGATIDPALATRLVNDVGDNPDQLSILQHALNRTWARWQHQGGRQGPLELKHYEAIGTMAHALDQHAERAFAELDTERKRSVCERIMKALTDWGTDARGTRRPTTLGTLCALTGATDAEVIGVIDVFRKPSRSFLMPPAGVSLHPEKVIDISHESLMRVWERLKTWGEEEARSAQTYRRLRDWGIRWANGDADLWRGPDLASATAWRQREAPRPEWAERHGGRDDLQTAMKFLDASEQAQRVEVAAVEARRQRQLRRAQHWAWGTGSVALVLLIGLLGYYWLQVLNHDAYFNTYVKRHGVPYGIGPLTAEQVRHRPQSYRITTQGYRGLVVRMDAVNAAGQLTTGALTSGFKASDEAVETDVRWEYVYDAKGQVAYEVSLDRSHQRVRSIVYSPVDPKTPNIRTAYLIGKAGSLAPQVGSCAAFLKYEYSGDGYEARTHYLDQIGNATAGKDGVAVSQQEFDQNGNMIKLISLWKGDRPMNDKAGNAEMRLKYDQMGNVVVAEAFDAAGAPINLVAGYQRATTTYDDRGNVVETAFFEAGGKPGKSEGCHRNRYDYDDGGNVVRVACLDALGQAALVVGLDYADMAIHYDGTGKADEFTYYDQEGKPVATPGTFRIKVENDEDGNQTSFAFFSAAGQPVLVSSEFHKENRTFEGGRKVRTAYLGVDGKPVEVAGGYVAVESGYDSHGNEERVAYLGASGRPVRNSEEGFAVKRASFDACGRETRTWYLDEHEKPISPGMMKYAVILKGYDEGDNVVEETYLNEKEQRTRGADGYSRVVRQYDRHRNVIDERYFDEKGKALLIERPEARYARLARRYDDHNALVDEAYFGVNGEAIANNEGWARLAYVKNAEGENIETTFFGINGKIAKVERRYASMTSRKNDGGAVVEEAYFGVDGKPVPKTETVYFGADGRPFRSETGYARVTRRYDDHNAVTEEAYFGPGGESVLSDDGWARVTNVNDERGRPIERAHFGVRGEPLIGRTELFHRATRVLDEHDNVLELATFGTDGKPLAIMDSGGKRRCARFVWRFDAKDKEIGSDCFDAAGKRVQ
ncbi:MAG: hypothetical protein ABIS29_13125, partial [Vicinamibacterales bacterium]